MDNTKMVSSSIKSPLRYYAGMLVGLGNRQVNYWDMECTCIGRFRLAYSLCVGLCMIFIFS